MRLDGLRSLDVERVQAVIFDVDGTLYRQSALRRRILARIVAAHGTRPIVGVRVMRALQAYRRAHEELRNQEFSTELQLAKTADQCGFHIDEVREIVARWFDHAPLDLLAPCVYPGAREFLELLLEMRVPCGVFSDYPAEAKLAAMGLKNYFGYLLCAADVGRQKPDPLGLLTMARQMGLEPARVLYVGDRAIDIQAATRARMQGAPIENKNSYSLLHDSFVKGRRQRLQY